MFKFTKQNLTKLVIPALIILILLGIIPAVRNPILDLMISPLKLASFLKREAGGIIFYHRNMVTNESLSREVDILSRKLNDLNELSLENTRLRNLLSFKQKAPFKVIPALVIGRSIDSWSSIIIIDKGSKQGLKRGMIVINHAGLLGRITEVTNYTSKVSLINDPSTGISAFIQRSRQEGLVSGTLGNSLTMRYLPKDADVVVSDVVITSGLTDLYPKGLLIGTVVEVADEFNGLSRYCTIKPVVDLSSIEEVMVIIP